MAGLKAMIRTKPVFLHHVHLLHKEEASFYPKFTPLFLPLAFSLQMCFPISHFHSPSSPHLALAHSPSLSPMAPLGNSHLSNNQQLLMLILLCLTEHNNGTSIKENFTPNGLGDGTGREWDMKQFSSEAFPSTAC